MRTNLYLAATILLVLSCSSNRVDISESEESTDGTQQTSTPGNSDDSDSQSTSGTYLIADHNSAARFSQIPSSFIAAAKTQFKIAYGHTSHGSQLITGQTTIDGGPDASTSSTYYFTSVEGTCNNDVFLCDRYPTGDLGSDGDTSWDTRTRALLNGNRYGRNVILWSWCGGAETTADNMQHYLDRMTALIADYPDITFIYMTGHLVGSGLDGDLHKRNEQIRAHVRETNGILFDFADIESYDPDGLFVLDNLANDNCDYDGDGNSSRESNWATAWCSAHPGSCPACECAHSQSLNCQLKAKAFWWLMARLAGWPG